METIINTIDSVMSIADVIEAVIQFTQRESVKQVIALLQQAIKAIIRIIGWLAIVLIYWIAISIQAVYANWKATLPIAIAEFHKGYDATHQDKPAAKVVEIAPSTSSISRTQQLRQACTAAGIQWRNAKGKSKHLNLQEMEAALSR